MVGLGYAHSHLSLTWTLDIPCWLLDILLMCSESCLPLMLLGCSHLNRYRYRYSVSPSGSLSFLSLSSSFDPDSDSDFDIDAQSNIRIQGTRIRKQKMDRRMRGLSRHAVARYRRGPGCVAHGGRTASAAEEKRMKACPAPGGAKPPAEPFLPAFKKSGGGGPCFAEAASQGKPAALQVETCLSQKPLFTQAGDNLEIRKAGRKWPLSPLFS